MPSSYRSTLDDIQRDKKDSLDKRDALIDSMIIDITKYINDEGISQDEVAGPFIRPIGIERTKNILSIPLRRSSRYALSAYEGLQEPIKEVSQYYKYVYKLHPANPNKQDVIDTLNSVFIGSTDVLKDAIDNAISNKLKRPIILEGPRGSGKSTLQNHFFNNNTKWLQDKGYVWIRCDAYKLYKIWELVGRAKFDVIDYLDAQLVYVTIKYSMQTNKYDKNELLEDVTKELGERTLSTINARGNNEDIKGSELIKWLMIKIENEQNEDSAMLKMVENYLQKLGRKAIESSRIESMSTAIKDILNDMGYKILSVIDGVDNITLHESIYEPFYSTMLKNIKPLFEKELDDLWLISLRPETVNDLKIIYQGGLVEPQGGEHSVGFPEGTKYVYHYPSPINKIFKVKTQVSIRPAINSFRSKKEYARNGLDENISNQQFDALLHEVNHYYIQKLGSTIRDLMPEKNYQNDDEAVQDVFGENIRALTQHKLSMLQLMMYSNEIRIGDNLYPTDIFQRWLIRNLFLNGRLFIESVSNDGVTPYEAMSLLPNIFWYNMDELVYKEKNIWHGLCGHRILQTIAKTKDIFTEEDTVEYLNNIFGYNKRVVKSLIKRFVVYGLLKYNLKTFIEEAPGRVKLEITSKGIFCQRLSFDKADITYFLALDTYLANGNKVEPHNNNNSLHLLFTEAVITLTSWFSKHLKAWHTDEMIKALRNYGTDLNELKGLSRPPLGNIQSFKETYDLPDTFPKNMVGGNMRHMLLALINDKHFHRVRDIFNAKYPNKVPMFDIDKI